MSERPDLQDGERRDRSATVVRIAGAVLAILAALFAGLLAFVQAGQQLIGWLPHPSRWITAIGMAAILGASIACFLQIISRDPTTRRASFVTLATAAAAIALVGFAAWLREASPRELLVLSEVGFGIFTLCVWMPTRLPKPDVKRRGFDILS